MINPVLMHKICVQGRFIQYLEGVREEDKEGMRKVLALLNSIHLATLSFCNLSILISLAVGLPSIYLMRHFLVTHLGTGGFLLLGICMPAVGIPFGAAYSVKKKNESLRNLRELLQQQPSLKSHLVSFIEFDPGFEKIIARI